MTHLRLEQPLAPDTGGAVVLQIATCVEELALLAGGGCLVESPSGRLVAHDLRCSDDPPEGVQKAVVSGETSLLHSALSRRRATGLLPTGAVLEGVLEDGATPVVHLALRDSGGPVGAVWLLVGAHRPTLDDLRIPVLRLVSLLACTTGDERQSGLAECLTEGVDGRLPSSLRHSERLWVAAVRHGANAPADVVLRSLSAACATLPDRVIPAVATRYAHHSYVVLGGLQHTSTTDVLVVLEAVLTSSADRLGQSLSAGLSDPSAPGGLAVARAQADAAADVAEPGTCAALTDVRALVVLRHLGESVKALPDLGRDPLATLDDYDRKHGGTLALSLLAWLDACGDVAQAAGALGVHKNTLRYRVTRAEELAGIDLRQDPPARLDLHLRLHCRRTRLSS